MRLVALALALLSSPVIANAAECASPFTVDDLLTELNRVEFAAQGAETTTALQAARTLEQGLGCMDTRMVPALVGRTYRSIAAGFVVGGETSRGEAWMRTAVEVDPQFSFGVEEFAADHPVSQLLRRLQQSSDGAQPVAAGRPFIEGKFYLDGRTVSEPAATLGRPHLLQLDAGAIRSWVIEGAAFPDDALASDTATASADTGDKAAAKTKKQKDPKPAKDPKAAKAATPAPPSSGTFTGTRVRPPEKTPLIIGGAALVVGAGAMYTGAILSRQKFDGIGDSEADLRRAQVTTNRLFLGSIAVLAIGAGTTTWGVILDGGMVMPHVNVRF